MRQDPIPTCHKSITVLKEGNPSYFLGLGIKDGKLEGNIIHCIDESPVERITLNKAEATRLLFWLQNNIHRINT